MAGRDLEARHGEHSRVLGGEFGLDGPVVSCVAAHVGDD